MRSSCCTTPIPSRIFRPSVRRSCPKIVARPEVGCRRVVSILIVVVLPAPFGPRKPKTSERSISNATRSTATLSPKRFESSWTRMTGSCPLMSHMPIFAAATMRPSSSLAIRTDDGPVRRREERVRVADALPDQERLRVADDALLREPSAKLHRTGDLFGHDAPVPLRDPLARAFLEETRRHVLHPLPITRLRH